MNGFCKFCGVLVTGHYCSQCGCSTHVTAARLPRPKAPRPTLHGESVDIRDVIKLLGIDQFLTVLRNTFRPLQHIRDSASPPQLQLITFVLSYAEFGAVIAFFNEYILKEAVAEGFPWFLEDHSGEHGLLSIIVVAIVNAFTILALRLLPDRLFRPVGKTKALCLLIVVLMYHDLYYVLSDGIFIIYWFFSEDQDVLRVARFARMLGIQLFALYAIRFGIGLSWGRAMILLAGILLLILVTAVLFFTTGLWNLV
jgi:hypothetical protein